MIKVGQKVRFNPFKYLHVQGTSDIDAIVEGTVIYVSEAHRWFGVEYSDDGETWRTSFKFDDIGDNVKVVR